MLNQKQSWKTSVEPREAAESRDDSTDNGILSIVNIKILIVVALNKPSNLQYQQL